MKYLTATVNAKPAPLLGVLGNTAQACTLANNDIVNSVWLSDKAGVQPGDSDAIEIPALGSAPLDTNSTTYAVTNGPTVQCLIMPGTGGWTAAPSKIQASINALNLAKDTTLQSTNIVLGTGIALPVGAAKDVSVQGVQTTLGTPAQDPTVSGLLAGIPNNIANTGVPLLGGSALVKNQSAVSQNPGASGTSSTFSMTGTGYEFFLTIYATGNFLSYFHLTLQWFDSNSGIQTGQEDYWFNPGSGSGASAHTIFGKGPVLGNQLVVISSVPSTSSVAVTHSYVILQNSRIYLEPDWQTIQFNTAGVSTPAADQTAGQLAAGSFSVGANSTSSRLFPFYNGVVSIWANTGSGTSDLDVQILNFADTSMIVGGAQPFIWEARTNANGFLYAENVPLPAGQSQILLNNNNASGRTCAFTATISRQR